GDDGDQERLNHHADYGVVPDLPALGIDVAGVVEDGDRSLEIAVGRAILAQWYGVDIQRCSVGVEELVVLLSTNGGLLDGPDAAFNFRGKLGGHGDGRAVLVVDGDADEAFAVAEALDNALQFRLCAFAVQAFDGFLQAFGEQLGSALELVATALIVLLDLVDGEDQGD